MAFTLKPSVKALFGAAQTKRPSRAMAVRADATKKPIRVGINGRRLFVHACACMYSLRTDHV
jgi:hypothetical protein